MPLRFLVLLLAPALVAAGDKWTEFHYGPYVVISSAGDKQAREALDRLEQFRYALSLALAKPDLTAPWPLTVVLAKRPLGAPARFHLSRDGYISEGLSTEALADLAHIFLDANAGALPDWVEGPLIGIYSRIEVSGTHVSLGAPPPPEGRTRDWARIQLLVTDPRYSGRFRVFLYDLQQTADTEPAYRNAFQSTADAIDREAGAYLAAGRFATTTVNAKAIHAERDFVGRPYDAAKADLLEGDLLLGASASADAVRVRQAYSAAHLAEARDGIALATLAKADLEAAIATPSTNARVWFEYGRQLADLAQARAAFQQAAKLNPKWAMPSYGLSQLETDPRRRAFYLAAAAKLEPRNLSLWQALATASTEADQFSEASKAWAQAERAATRPEERERIHQLRAGLTEKRLDQEAAERRRVAEEKQREIDKLRDEALARIHEAEARANKGNAPLDPKTPVVSYAEVYGENPKAAGLLERVDCLGAQARLTIRAPDRGKVRLLVRDPSKVAITGRGKHALACGPQTPARKLTVQYRDLPDTELGTLGEVVTIEFQ